MTTTFRRWLAERADRLAVSAPYSLLPTISQAGKQGITRQDLGQRYDLDPEALDGLLTAMASVGWITARREGGQIVYRAV